MSENSEILSARSALGLATRRGDEDGKVEARRALAAAKVAAYIERALSEAPPLTEAQGERLRTVLGGALRNGGAR